MRMMRERVREARRDDGFTLIEMIVTVAILGVISIALFGIVIQYLKTTQDTRARLSESTDQQFISTYWQNDVSSLGKQDFVADEPAYVAGADAVVPRASVDLDPTAGCGSGPGRDVIVRFEWHEFATGSTPATAWDVTEHSVAYVAVDAGDGRRRLERVRCRPSAADDRATVAHSLVDDPDVDCDTACEAATPPNRVWMSFTVKDADNPDSPGYTTRVTADRRQDP